MTRRERMDDLLFRGQLTGAFDEDRTLAAPDQFDTAQYG
jgi:hypothetical protein